MNHSQLFILVVLVLSATCYKSKNTTQFWQNTLNLSSINYQSYAGYQQIDWYYQKQTSGMFYSLFGAFSHDIMNQSQTIPLIVWLQGGPGSGSQFGAFTEIGPIRILKGIPKSLYLPWNIFGNLLFIDSPLNVGFSFQGERHRKVQVSNTNQTTDHLINFLTNFYTQFPSLKKSPLYIAGESYAGHYIPNLAKKILANQTFLKNTGVKLAGISIGDGWVDPVNQINFFDSYLWSVGIVPNKFRNQCTLSQTHAIVNIYEGNFMNATKYLYEIKTSPQTYMGNVSIYNFRNYEQADQSFVQFLNYHKQQFGAKVDYIDSNKQVQLAFVDDITKSYASDLTTVLRSIKVLIYNGQNDVIVNTAGVLQYLNGLNWSGIPHWKKTNKQMWTIYGQNQGWAKVSGNLWFVLVNGAGHMVPTDKPQAAFSMFGHFITNDNDWKQ